MKFYFRNRLFFIAFFLFLGFGSSTVSIILTIICGIFILFLVGYNVSINKNEIRESIFNLNIRSVELKQVRSIEADYAPWGIELQQFPYIRGEYAYKYFPFYEVSDQFLISLIKLRPEISIDSYLANRFPEELRLKKNLKLSKSDKSSNVLGYILYLILFLLLGVIILFVIGTNLFSLFKH